MPTKEEYRALEMEGLMAGTLAGGRPGGRRIPYAALGVIAATVLGWTYWRSSGPAPRNMTQPDSEEFRTTQFPAPIIDAAPTPQRSDRILVRPDPPPSPPPPPAPPPTAVAQPPPLPADDLDARRRAEEERRRLEEEERRRWERLRSPMILIDNAGAIGSINGDPSTGGAARVQADVENDPNRRFLNSAGNAGVEVSLATRNNRIDALVPQGTMIRGVLETAIQSDLPGQVRAITTDDVWSFDGRRILISNGSRLIGDYRSGVTRGQTRIFIVWTRMLRSDGVSVQLGSIGTDPLGRSGLTGFVDNHYLERFGSALFLSILGAGVAYALDDRTASRSSSDLPPEVQRALDERDRELGRRRSAAETIAQTMTGLARDALQDSLSIPPTIHVDQGTRISIFVRRDLDFSALYPDPIREALQELRYGRRPQADMVSRPGAQISPGLVRKP